MLPESRPPTGAGADLLDPRVDAQRLLRELRQAIQSGRDWYLSLLETIGRWRLPSEEIDGRHFQYLIADEAFDWLLLAERLTETVADLVPENERLDLLFYGIPPVDLPEEMFKDLLGATKYRAHLNFLYGVVLEEALLVSVQREIEKENRSRAYREDRRVVETLHQRLYGQSLETLRGDFQAARGAPDRDVLTQGEWKEFVYWLFKRRLRYWDKARIASDTRKAIQSYECLRGERRRHLARAVPDEVGVIEATLVEPGDFPDPFRVPPEGNAFDTQAG